MVLNYDHMQLHRLFQPSQIAARERIVGDGCRFVHYTTAENALEIIRSRSIWMRSTQCMNDYSEVETGVDNLVAFFHDGASKDALFQALDKCTEEGFSESVVKTFDKWLPSIRNNSYITCISEHDPSEDQHGRLSMWRAYGGVSRPGVAIVLNNAPFMRQTDSLGIYSSPVSYFSRDQFSGSFRELVERINQNCELIKAAPLEFVRQTLFLVLLEAAICSKHEGFREEMEWRVFAHPDLFPSSIAVRSIKTINGVPQPIYKIPLKNDPERDVLGIEIPDLVNRTIIGPTEFPMKVSEAFVDELHQAGCEDATRRVVISGIPLRT